jgi:drug/metabolite transporter (DMT)-like permease
MTEDRLHRRGVGAVWLATFIWAWGPVLVKWSALSGPTFAMCRLWVGVCVSAIALLVTGRRMTWTAFRACAVGGVLFAADIGLGFTAIVLVSSYRLHEPVSVRSWVLVGASFVGVVIVAVASAGAPSWTLGGDLLAVLGIGTWSAYWFFSRHVRERFDPIVYFACVMLAGALTMTPFALLVDGVPSALAGRDVFAVVTVAIFPGFIGHTLVIWSHKHVASWLSALITQVSPVITAVLAWIVLGEAIGPVAALGGAITVGATMAVIALDAGEADEQHLEEAAEKVS